MIIETERLYLREMQKDDFKALYNVLADTEIMRYYPNAFDEEKVKSWIERNIERYSVYGFGLWAVVLKDTGEVIGDCGLTMQNIDGKLKPEIGYHIRADKQRKGYAKESAIAVRDWTFRNTTFDVIYSYMKYDNVPSIKTALSYGCKQVDEFEDEVNGVTKVFAISRDEWSKENIMKDITIRLETENDYRAVETLTRGAFWNVYKPGADEHYFVHMMRNHPDFIPELAFVLEKDGEIIGNIMYTKAWLEDEDGNRKEILSFGPLCVAPEYQRQKLGKILIEHSFEVARKMGYDVNINFGNPGNYVSRGFVSCKKKNVSFVVDGNFPTALLVCELVPGVLDGKKWMYIPSTAADCCDDTDAVEAFDATFPPMEKKWKPSQEEFYIYRNSSVVRG